MLGRKAIGSLRVILDIDPAIVGGDYDRYRKSFFDEKHLRLDPANPPTRFLIKQLTDPQKDAVQSQPHWRARAKMGGRCALLALENYALEKPDGVIEKNHALERKDHGRLGEIITEECFEALNFPAMILGGLYAAIDWISDVHLPLSKPSAPQSGPTGSGCQASTDSSRPSQTASDVTSPCADGKAAV